MILEIFVLIALCVAVGCVIGTITRPLAARYVLVPDLFVGIPYRAPLFDRLEAWIVDVFHFLYLPPDKPAAPAPSGPIGTSFFDGYFAGRPAATEPAPTPAPVAAPLEAAPAPAPADAARAADASALGTRPAGLAAPVSGAPDDLKLINGIGPANEAKLHALGIWHFAQIAAWTPENAAWIGSYLAFPGRIEREDWIAQAKRLAARETA